MRSHIDSGTTATTVRTSFRPPQRMVKTPRSHQPLKPALPCVQRHGFHLVASSCRERRAHKGRLPPTAKLVCTRVYQRIDCLPSISWARNGIPSTCFTYTVFDPSPCTKGASNHVVYPLYAGVLCYHLIPHHLQATFSHTGAIFWVIIRDDTTMHILLRESSARPWNEIVS